MQGMVRTRTVAWVSALLLVVGACRQAPPSVDRDVEAIRALRERIQSAENAGRAEEMAAAVATDVIVLPPNAVPINGQAAFTDFLRSAFQSVTMSVQYQSEETVVSGAWGFDRGTYVSTVTPKAGGAGVREPGKYLWLTRRGADGSWRYARIIWNSDAAATVGK
jgi:ketosteroid isomerase-like protein